MSDLNTALTELLNKQLNIPVIPIPVPVKPDRPGGQIATVNGKKVYIEGSTMRDVYGFETVDQYNRAQTKGYKPGTFAVYGPLLEKPKFIGTEDEYKEYQKDYKSLANRLGFEQTRIEAYNRQVERQNKNYIKALRELEPYRTGENSYNLNKAISDKVSERYLATVFSKKDIEKAKAEVVQGQIVQQYASTVKPTKVSIPKSIWRMLTPWAEEKGETFLAYVKGTPSRALSKDVGTQAELKAAYENQKEQPMWMRVLFGQQYVKRNGQYYRVVVGEAPMISPAGRATKLAQQAVDIGTKKLPALKTITPEDLGINEKTFEVLLKMRLGKLRALENWPVKPTIQQVKEEIKLLELAKRGTQTISKEAFKLDPIKAQRDARLAQIIREKGIKAYYEELGKLANQGDKDAIAWLKSVGKLRAATTAEARAFTIPGRLTYSKMEDLLKEWASQKPGVALKNMNDTGGLLPAVATKPEVVARALPGQQVPQEVVLGDDADPAVAVEDPAHERRAAAADAHDEYGFGLAGEPLRSFVHVRSSLAVAA